MVLNLGEGKVPVSLETFRQAWKKNHGRHFRISKKSQFQTANYVPEMYGVPPLHIVYASQFGHLSLDFCLLGMEYPDP